MWRPASWLGVGVLVFACAAESSDDDGHAGGPNGPNASAPGGPIEAEDFPTVLATTVCGDLSGCCREADIGYDRGTCEITLRQLYGGVLKEALESDDYDPEQAADCLAALSDSVARCDFGRFGGEACARVFIVSPDERELGEECGQSCERTASGVTCYVGGTDEGECYREAGLYCDATSWTCAPLLADGQACFDSDECEGHCSDGVCARRVGEGEHCSDSRSCLDGLVCHLLTLSCAPPGQVGDSCWSSDECATGTCSEAGSCEEDSGGSFLAVACGG